MLLALVPRLHAQIVDGIAAIVNDKVITFSEVKKRVDPTERDNLLIGEVTAEAAAVADELSLLLNDWREKTHDVIPSEFAGTRISARYTETYLHIQGSGLRSRSAIAAERGIEEEVRAPQ